MLMGCSASKEDEEREGERMTLTTAYLGMAMLQANKAAALMAGGPVCTAELEHEMAQRLIRKAKNEGCTVSVVDGCLYVDYKFIGYLPPDINCG